MGFKSIFFFVITLLTIGTLAITSIETMAESRFEDPLYNFLGVTLRITAGVIAFLIFSIVDHRIHKDDKVVKFYYFATISALALVILLPSEGSRRWIRLAGFSIQPSEFAKLFVILYLSKYVSDIGEEIKDFLKGVVKPFLFLSPILALIFLEPDFSTTILLISLIILILYNSGARSIHIFTLFLIFVSLAITAYLSGFLKPYQMARISTFIRGKISEQTLMALESLKSGGIIGKGVGLGSLKAIVPVVESDFILAAIGEELGYVGIAIVLLSYFGLVRTLIRLSERFVEDTFSRTFMAGYAYLIMLQVMVNLGVNAGLLPVTGIPLPFVSRGGSALLSLMAGLGVMTNMVYGSEEG